MASDLIERLKKCALGSADEDVMVRWDKIRAILKQDKGGTWPRECFESIIDGYAEDCEDAVKEIASLRTALAVERERAEKAEQYWQTAIAMARLHESQALAAEASLAEARALMKVFADAEILNDAKDCAKDWEQLQGWRAAERIKFADLRAAARFLAQEEGR